MRDEMYHFYFCHTCTFTVGRFADHVNVDSQLPLHASGLVKSKPDGFAIGQFGGAPLRTKNASSNIIETFHDTSTVTWKNFQNPMKAEQIN